MDLTVQDIFFSYLADKKPRGVSIWGQRARYLAYSSYRSILVLTESIVVYIAPLTSKPMGVAFVKISKNPLVKI